jgi:uncharacterized protein (TIGR02246 family)
MSWDAAMPTTTPDISAIEAVIADVAAGLVARDADACVAAFAPDARSITGQRLVGRDAIRDAHIAAFATGGVPTTPRFVILDVHLVRPDVAIVTTGAYAAGPDEAVDLDAPPTLVTWTMVHDDDRWTIAARQFSRMTP